MVNPAGIAITYGYDAASQRAWMNQPTGLFTYSHDPAGRIANLINPEGQTTSWQYDAASRVTATVMANGTLASNTYDSCGSALAAGQPDDRRHDPFELQLHIQSGRKSYAGRRGQRGCRSRSSYDPTYQLTNETAERRQRLQHLVHLRSRWQPHAAPEQRGGRRPRHTTPGMSW